MIFAIKGKSLNETQKTHTKGGGVIHTVDNNVLLGPNAIEVPDREDYTTDSKKKMDKGSKKTKKKGRNWILETFQVELKAFD